MVGSMAGGMGGEVVRVVKEEIVRPRREAMKEVSRHGRLESEAEAKPKGEAKVEAEAEAEAEAKVEAKGEAKVEAGAEEQEEEEEEEEEEEMFLTAIDIMCRGMPYNRRLLLYGRPAARVHTRADGDGDGDYERLVFTLKRSLASALCEFYPLAGRLVDGDDDDRMHLRCNRAGAVFVEAVVDADADADFGLAQQPPYFDLLVPNVHNPAAPSLPLLLLQVSRFNCGSIALGVAHSHVVCDGTSLWHFVTSWAECARGERISVLPVHMRRAFSIESPSPEKARLIMEHVDEAERFQRKEEEEIKLGMFRFERDVIAALKAEAGDGHTAYEAICAHMWRRITRARGQSERGDERVVFISAVNMRRRMEGAVGEAFFGNGAMWTTATATAEELRGEGLRETARRIRDSVRRFDAEAFSGLLHWLELHGPRAVLDACALNAARLRVSSSPRFPVFDADFGWGPPLAVRCPRADLPGKIIFFPGPPDSGFAIDAILALPAHVMCHLESDFAFTHPSFSPYL